MNRFQADYDALIGAMRQGGYYRHIMGAGRELDRVKDWLRAFERPDGHAPREALQYPDYPLFPGLRHRAFHDPGELEGAAILERHAARIREEWAALPDAAYLRYAPAAMHSLWLVHLLHYMGVAIAAPHGQCAGTRALLPDLPDVCLDYPWGDALLSVHACDSHLRAHCSVDNLRVRCHLGLQVPPGCSIRVGTETRQWEEGRALLFEDSFEHEVWNRGDRRRSILIVDFWHPDLTAVERAAVTAGFRRTEIRRLFMWRRMQVAQGVPDALRQHLDAEAGRQDAQPDIARYWG